MQTIINLVAKFSGITSLWEKLDGYKTYIGAGLKILTAIVALLTELKDPIDAHNAGAIFTFFKELSHNPQWSDLTDGIFALGIGHKVSKTLGK